jgi:hypothetical protein
MGRREMERSSPAGTSASHAVRVDRPAGTGVRTNQPLLDVIGEHERVTFSACIRWLTGLAVGLSCVAAVIVFGELSTGALLAVGGTGVLVAVVGLARRSGEAALPVGRRGLPWLGWLAAGLAWEFLTLLDDDLLTVSDLADRVLAHPPVRAAATLAWLIAGAWLLTRPRHHPQP